MAASRDGFENRGIQDLLILVNVSGMQGKEAEGEMRARANALTQRDRGAVA